MKNQQCTTSRLVSIIEEHSVLRARELAKYRIHPEILSRAASRGMIVKVGRGLYARKGLPTDIQHQIVLAMKRVPHGVVCLESALIVHGMLPAGPGPIWVAIDRRARKPMLNGQLLQFVRFGGGAFTQGVISTKIDGVHVRVYSVAKTVADCLKYRKRIRANVAQQALEQCLGERKCSIERLRHFAKICRVKRFIRQAYSSAT
jgi:predicted transcriptional regulator of viral defense system